MSHLSRRRFLRTAATAAVAAYAAPAILRAADAPAAADAAASAGRKLNVAVVGVTGRGGANLAELVKLPNASVISLCDVDANHLAAGLKVVPSAKGFASFRDLLRLPDLDAVLVSTPDHTHAPITAACLRAGKHVYCEKPLTHTVADARAISRLAKETGLCTQLGIQIHSMDNYRRVVELVRAGAIGPVREVHVWHNRVNRRPAKEGTADVPPQLNYDLWLGPAAYRPFNPDFHPYNWRRRWSFGCGLMGDIACHLMDVAFWALDLDSPTAVAAAGPAPDDDVTPEWLVVNYDFPARGSRPGVKLTWYDPPHKPEALKSWNLPEKLQLEGVMFVGDDGLLCTNYTQHALLPESKYKDFARPPQTIAKSPGHQAEWVNACLAGDPSLTTCPFTYGGLLTESALLGNLAHRYGKPLTWHAATMRFPGHPDAEHLLRAPARPGWAV